MNSASVLNGTVVDHTPRHDGGYLVRVQTPQGVKVARALRAHAVGTSVSLRGLPPDFSVEE